MIRKQSGHRWQKIRQSVIARDKGLCVACKARGNTNLGKEVDHITPLAKGGTDDLENLQLLCVACHERKTRADMNWSNRQQIGLDGWPVEGMGR
jgi:5-methylcytosine-specific restriction protein A